MTSPSPASSSSSSLEILHVHLTRGPNKKLAYTFTLPNGQTYPMTRTQAADDEQDKGLFNAAARIHQWSSLGDIDPDAGEATLSQLGITLAKTSLPPEVLDFVFGSSTPLAIQTNDPTFPWELLGSGGRTLGQLRPLGRLLVTQRDDHDATPRATSNTALLVGNPTQDPSAAMEGEITALQRALAAHRPPFTLAPLYGPSASYGAVKERLERGGALFHFAGHVSFDPKHPKVTSLVFPDGLVIDAATLEDSVGAFAFVFINGCASARAALQSQSEQFSPAGGGRRIRGLATPFLANGAAALIGTLWPVADESAAEFARAFYDLALAGVPLGEALRMVRDTWRTKFRHNPTWGAYILYGDPRLTLDATRDPSAPLAQPPFGRPVAQVHLSSGAVTSNARMRGSRAEEFFLACYEAGGDDDEDDDDVVDDDEVGAVRLDLSGAAAIERAISWVRHAHWRLMARFDLFLGLALVEDSLVARGLRAYGISGDEIKRMNMLMFGIGKNARDITTPSDGVASALRRSARIASVDGRDEVSANDIALGLLDMPSVSGSLHRALRAMGIAPRDLLAAGRGEPARRVGSMPSLATAYGAYGGVQSAIITQQEELLLGDNIGLNRNGDKSDTTPRPLLRDLRDEVTRAIRRTGPRPFIGREQELRAVIRILTRPSGATVTPHVVIRGPSGVGANALAYALATKLVTDPEAGEFAPIRDWDIMAVRISRESKLLDTWLRAEISNRSGTIILVIEDLPELLSFRDTGLPGTLAEVARHANIRIVAVANGQAYSAIRDDYPELARLFNVVALDPPRPELAVVMVQAHIDRLQRRYKVTIAADAPAEAVILASRYSTRSLPGSAVALLERVCAIASHDAIAAGLERDWRDWLKMQASDTDDTGDTGDAGNSGTASDVPASSPAATSEADSDTFSENQSPFVTAALIRSLVTPDSGNLALTSRM